jgi:hypothetical protein
MSGSRQSGGAPSVSETSAMENELPKAVGS